MCMYINTFYLFIFRVIMVMKYTRYIEEEELRSLKEVGVNRVYIYKTSISTSEGQLLWM